jgi:hypothetical protein
MSARARHASVKKPLTPDRKAVSCGAKNAEGKPCAAAAVRGTQRCLFHTKGQASRAGREGGRPKVRPDVSQLKKFTPPKDAGEMRLLLATMICEMREAKIDLELASKIAYVASVFLKSAEIEELKEVRTKVQELETRFAAVKGAPRR